MATTLTTATFQTKPPGQWGLQDAKDAVAHRAALGITAPALKSNRLYAEERNHWQGGDTWPGPLGGGDERVKNTILGAVERQYTPVDVVNEVLDRFGNAMLKHRPTLDFVPLEAATTPEGEASEDESTEATVRAEAQRLALRQAVAEWAQRTRLVQKARQALRRSRYATRGLLRVWVPPGKLVARTVDDGQPTQRTESVMPTGLSFAEALANVEVTAPLPDTAAVLVDEATRARVGVFLYTKTDQQQAAEVWMVDPVTGETVCRVIDEKTRALGAGDTDQEPEETARLRMAGLLPIAELEGELLITEPVRRQQARLNFVESTLNRVVETGGFPERYVINAAPQGYWTPTEVAGQVYLDSQERTAPDGSKKTFYLYATPRTLGAAVTTELRGIPAEVDDTGKRTFTTPGVVFRDPTDPTYIVTASEHCRATILRSCKQGHIVLEARGQATGIAYEQARAEFEDDVQVQAPDVEAFVAEIVSAACALAALMTRAGDPGATALAKYRVSCTVHIDTGPRSPDATRADGEAVEAGRLPRETAMQRDGVQDVDGALAKIAADPVQRAARSKAQAEAVAAWTTAGAGLDAAAELVGLSEDERQILVTNAGRAPGDDGITQ